jgi:integrase
MIKKPTKPYEGFPLYAHGSGHWAKKIRGKTHYFGRWDGDTTKWKAALELFEKERDALYAGRDPNNFNEGLVLGRALDLFLSSKIRLVRAGELTQRTYDEYHGTCKTLASSFGRSRSVESLGAGDFESLRAQLAKRYGPVRLAREIVQVRMVFRYCYESQYLDRPVRFGPSFRGPKKRELRLARHQNGLRFFEAEEITTLVNKAKAPLKAMVLLGVNCGFGNHDCGRLEFHQLDLEGGWHNMPRSKTGTARRAKLWPETIEAVRAAIEKRPKGPENLTHLVFLTKRRQSWFKETRDNPIANEFRKLLDETGLYRRGRTFYALRHTFETVAGECRDQVAVDHVMGHLRDDMASVYREKISDDRLKIVADTAYKWWKGV